VLPSVLSPRGGLGVLLLTVVVRRVVYYTSGKTAGYKITAVRILQIITAVTFLRGSIFI
jgi:hypothetical protein